ncbi:MAG: hypothetical protein U5R06_09475 [candidate division KSB1 bacterium]|nr:hypothetical protein [candidate division KSB1 bacterium]
MRAVLTIMICSLLILGTACNNEQHAEHMNQDYSSMHRGSGEMTGMPGMADHMNDLQTLSGQMRDDWQQHMEARSGVDTVYGHSMITMSGHMHDMARDMNQVMNTMNSLMNDSELMQNREYKTRLEQMQKHMNLMMQNYQSMLEQMNEMRQTTEP